MNDKEITERTKLSLATTYSDGRTTTVSIESESFSGHTAEEMAEFCERLLIAASYDAQQVKECFK